MQKRLYEWVSAKKYTFLFIYSSDIKKKETKKGKGKILGLFFGQSIGERELYNICIFGAK